MIDRIIDFALKRRLLTVFLLGLVCLWGVVVYIRMPKDIYPDLNAPIVNIITDSPGMASEDVERLITFPLESLLSGAPGITRVRSETSTGSSIVTAEFDWGTDIYRARQIVSSKLELIAGRLPQGSTQPVLGPVSSRMGEVFEFAVTGGEGTDPMELRSTVVATRRNVPIYVKDVADVRVGGRFRREDASYNGREAVYVTVEKQYGGDTWS